MSRTIDERIVEMQFNNQQFEQNVHQSMGTLEKLKQLLKFDKSTTSLSNLNAASRKFDMSGISNAVSEVHAKFSALDVVGVTALANIANQAINTGKQMLNSLTIAPISDGFREYELKIGSVQTILASTGEKLSDVNKYLEDLNTYSDKTIYSFSDMTSNIGKFTNAGVKLKDAVAAIKGISNVAAVSGANAAEASRAMYNFSQALSSGAVKLIDWKSIENANMSTVEFKNTLMETAVAMGTVVKEGDKYRSTTTNLQGKVSELFTSTQGFNESLAHQWMTTDVLTQALELYATDVRELNEEERKAYEDKLRERFSDEQIKRFEDLGVKAADAATKVRTFTQLMDTLKEAVGSGWAQTFEILFGDFDFATKYFTKLSDFFGDFFGKQAEKRNEMLKEWAAIPSIEDGARGKLFRAFARIGARVSEYIDPIKRAWKEIMPEFTAQTLGNITFGFANKITKHMKWFESTYDRLYETSKGVFSIVKLIGNVFINLGKYGIPVIQRALGVICRQLLNITGPIGNDISEMVDELLASGKIEKTIKGIADSLWKFIDTVDEGITVLRTKGFKGFTEWFSKLFDIKNFDPKSIFTAFKNKFSDAFKDFTNTVGSLFGESNLYGKIKDGAKTFTDSFKYVVDSISNIPLISNVVSGIQNLFKPIADWFSSLLEKNGFLSNLLKFGDDAKKISDNKTVFESFGDVLRSIIDGFANFGTYAKDLKDGTLKTLDNFGDKFGKFINGISGNLGKVDWVGVAAVAGQIGTMAVAFEAIATIARAIATGKGLVEAAITAMGAVKTFFSNVNNILTKFTFTNTWVGKFRSIAKSVLILSASIFIVAQAIIQLGQLKQDEIDRGVGGFIVIAGVLTVMQIVLSKFGNGIEIGTAVSIAAMAVAVKIIVSALVDMANLMAKFQGQGTLLQDAFANLVIIMGVMLGVVAALGLIQNKIGPLGSVSGMITVVGFVLALKLLVTVLSDLSKINLSWGIVGQLGIVLGAMLALAGIAAATQVGVGAGIGMLGMVLALKILVSLFDEIAKIDTKAVLANVDGLIVIGIALAYMALILRLAGERALKAGVGILAIAIAMTLMVGVIKTIGTMDPEVALKGVLGLIVLMVAISGLLNATAFSGEYAIRAGAAILLIAIALNLLVIPVFLLGSMKASTALKGVSALIILMLGVSALMFSTAEAGQYAIQAGVAILLITLALNGLVYAVYMLGNIQSSKLFKAVAAIAALGLMLGALMVFTKFTGASSWTGILAIAGAMTMLTLSLVALALVPQENLGNALNVIKWLGIVMIALMAVSQVTNNSSAKKIIIMTACVALLSALMVGVAFALKALDIDPDAMSKQFNAMMKVMLAMAAIMAVVGLFNVNEFQLDAAFGFIAKLTLFFGALGGILIAINEATGGGLAQTIEDNLKVLENVGKAIGTFFHGIGEALFGGQQQAPQQVEQVKTFGDKIAELVDTLMGAADKLNGKESSLNSLKSLVGIVAEFGKAEIMDAIANFVGGGKTDFSSFGTQLSQLADGLVQFNDKLVDANIDPKVADSAVTLAKKLAEIYGMDDIKSGGFIQKILGESIGLDKLGSQLAELATGLKQYADNLGDTDFGTDTIEKSKGMLDFLADLYGREALKSGGLIGSILGNSIGLDQLGVQLSGLAIGMSIYANTLSGVTFNEDSIKKSEDILDFIADLSGRDSLNQGGFLGMLLGNTIPFDQLGTQLAGLATGMAAYALAISKAPFDEEAAAKSDRLMQMLGTITSLNISKEGGLAGLIFGGSGLGKLASELPKLAEGVAGFVSKVQEAGISAEGIDTATRIVGVLTSISSTANYLSNGTDLTAFGTALKGFAKSIQDFLKDYTAAQESLARVNTNVFRAKFEEIMDSYNMVLDEIALMPTSVHFDFSGVIQSLTQAVTDISNMADSMVTTFSDAVDSVKGTLKSNLEGLKSIVDDSLSSTSEAFGSAGETMAAKLKASFGANIGDFIEAVQDTMNKADELTGGADVIADWFDNGEKITKALARGIVSEKDSVENAGERVSRSGISGIRGTKDDWHSVGENLSNALARGIRSGRSNAVDAAVSVAVSAYNAAKSALAINSPSKLFIKLGQGIDEGFIVGMERMSGDVADTSTLVATGIVNAAKDPLDYLADLMSGDIIDDPTITPVLDLSEIQNGANRLYSMMSDVDRYSLNGNIALANDASLSINRDQRRRQESENQMMGTLIDAINGLSALIGNTGNVYNVNGVTYDDGSNVSSAVRSLIRAAKIEGRA